MSEVVKFQGQDVHLITFENSKIWVAPQYGGRLLRWTIGDQELICWPEDADWSRVNKIRGGNPILFPFIARHMIQGEIGFWKDGDTVREMPMHGFARDMAFEVIEANPSELVMRLKDNESTKAYYPFAFHFDIKITLQKEHALRISLCTSNLSERPMPYYTGHHFYFNIPKEERANWKIKIPCSQTARQKPAGNIIFNSRNMVETDLSDESLIDRFHIMEEDQPVTFQHDSGSPKLKIRLDHPETVPWGAVTTWTQSEDSDFYCVEPWTGLPNAIHHQHGLRWIEPGDSEEAICKIEAEI